MTFNYIINHWLMDIDSSSLIHKETQEKRKLGEYQFRLLQVLAESPGKILSRDELNAQVWEKRVIVNNSLPNAIHALRVALDDNGKQKYIIRTISKKGYTLEADHCQQYHNPLNSTEVREADLTAISASDDTKCAEVTTRNAVTATRLPLLSPSGRSASASVYSSKFWRVLFLVQLAAVLILSAALVKTLYAEPAESEALNQNVGSSENNLSQLTSPSGTKASINRPGSQLDIGLMNTRQPAIPRPSMINNRYLAQGIDHAAAFK